MREVYIIGVGHTAFGKFLDRSVKSLTEEAVKGALADARIEKKDLDIVFFGNAMQDLVTRQEMVRGQVALRPLGIDRIPIANCENACTTGSTAFHLAWQSISGGHAEVALAVGAEKLFMEDQKKMFENFDVGMDMEILEALKKKWSDEAKKFGDGKETINEMPRSFAMDMYADICRAHIKAFGSSKEDLAVVASKNHNHSVHSPYAQFRKPMTVEEILTGRSVVNPLTVPMCSPIGDGGTAAILCSGTFLKRVKDPRPVKILASAFRSGADRPEGFGSDYISARLGRQAYETAGLGPEDIDVLEVHDATSLGELIHVAALGFCAWEDSAAMARLGATSLG